MISERDRIWGLMSGNDDNSVVPLLGIGAKDRAETRDDNGMILRVVSASFNNAKIWRIVEASTRHGPGMILLPAGFEFRRLPGGGNKLQSGAILTLN